MVMVLYDIVKFNNHVKTLVEKLQAKGETTNNFLTNLFKGYSNCTDKTFVNYVKRKQEAFEEGDNTIYVNLLMQQASTKYKILKESGKWNAPLEEEEQILALKAEVTALKRKRGSTKDKNKSGSNSSTSSSSAHGKQKLDWMTQRPKAEDLTKPKKWNNKTW